MNSAVSEYRDLSPFAPAQIAGATGVAVTADKPWYAGAMESLAKAAPQAAAVLGALAATFGISHAQAVNSIDQYGAKGSDGRYLSLVDRTENRALAGTTGQDANYSVATLFKDQVFADNTGTGRFSLEKLSFATATFISGSSSELSLLPSQPYLSIVTGTSKQEIENPIASFALRQKGTYSVSDNYVGNFTINGGNLGLREITIQDIVGVSWAAGQAVTGIIQFDPNAGAGNQRWAGVRAASEYIPGAMTQVRARNNFGTGGYFVEDAGTLGYSLQGKSMSATVVPEAGSGELGLLGLAAGAAIFGAGVVRRNSKAKE